MTSSAAACTANGGFGSITWPGAVVLVAIVLAGAWVIGRWLS